MKRILVMVVLGLFLATGVQAKPGKILMVLTSHSELGDTGRSTGFYLSEVTHPYEVFIESGYKVDFVSPQGGHPPIDGAEKMDEVTKNLMGSEKFRRALATTKRPDQIKIEDYQAIFFAGGHGTMWDLPNHESLPSLTAKMHEQGGVVAAVCHGPVALVNVKLSDGSYLVAGQPVAAFTNEEEAAVGLTEVMPFLLETKLRERGAKIQKTANWKPKVAVGDRLITGQNPASATGVAQAIVDMLSK